MDCITNNMEDMAVLMLKNPFMQFFLIEELQAALKLKKSKLSRKATIDQLQGQFNEIVSPGDKFVNFEESQDTDRDQEAHGDPNEFSNLT